MATLKDKKATSKKKNMWVFILNKNVSYFAFYTEDDRNIVCTCS